MQITPLHGIRDLRLDLTEPRWPRDPEWWTLRSFVESSPTRWNGPALAALEADLDAGTLRVAPADYFDLVATTQRAAVSTPIVGALPRPSGVLCLVRDPGGVLLTRRSTQLDWAPGRYLASAAEGFEPADASVLDAARRVVEEIGLAPDQTGFTPFALGVSATDVTTVVLYEHPTLIDLAAVRHWEFDDVRCAAPAVLLDADLPLQHLSRWCLEHLTTPD